MAKKKALFLICGSESYLKQQKKNELLRQFGAEENSLNFNVFSGREIDFLEVARLCDTMPFMSQWRVILIEDSGQMKLTPDKDLYEAASGLPESTALIFIEQETDAANALYKLVRETGEIHRFQKVSDKSGKEAKAEQLEVRRWAMEYLKKNHRKMDTKRMEELLELTGYDMENLKSELDKLISYTEGQDPAAPIGSSDIQAICSRTLQDQVFELLAAKLSGNVSRALELFEEMLAMRISPLRVLFMLARQFNQVYLLKDLSGSSYQQLSDVQIAQKIGIKKDWQLRKLKEQSVRLGKQDARAYLELCAEMETRIKRGDLDGRIAVEMLLAM